MEKLVAYRVGDHEFYAAYSREGALKEHYKHNEITEETSDETLDDVVECDAFELAIKWVDEDSREFLNTTQGYLDKTTEPGWIIGSE